MSFNLQTKKLANITDNATKFDAILYLPRYVETSIALLLSSEKDIVLRALQVITRHASLHPLNALDLYKKGIFPKLLVLLYHKDLNVLKFTLNLMAQLVEFSEVLDEFEGDSERPNVKQVCKYFLEHEEPFVMECTARILTKLIPHTLSISSITTPEVYKKIFDNLTVATDPDTQKNNLELLYQICCRDRLTYDLVKIEEFSASLLVCYGNCEVEMISEIVMSVINKMSQSSSKLLMEKLMEEKIAARMLEVVLNVERERLHGVALETLTNLLLSFDIARDFAQSPNLVHFSDWVENCEEKYLVDCATILFRICRYPELRQHLADVLVENAILSLFRSNHALVLAKACSCVSSMSTNQRCCEKMLTPVVLKCLIAMLTEKSPHNFEMVVTTIHNFLTRNERMKEMLANYGGISAIVSLFTKFRSKMSPENYLRIMDMIHMFALTPKYSEEVIDRDTFALLLQQFVDDPSSVIARKAIEIMTCCIHREDLRVHFLSTDGPRKLAGKLGIIRNETLLKSALLFVHNICCYKELTPYFLKNGIVAKLKRASVDVVESASMINRIMEMMYDLYLPLKFHKTGRLEARDRIGKRFYIMHWSWTGPFQFLEVLEEQQVCPILPIYVVDFRASTDLLYETRTRPVGRTSGSWRRRRTIPSLSEGPTENFYSLPVIQEGEATKDNTFLTRIPAPVNYGSVSDDPYLSEYALEVYHRFFSSEVGVCLYHKIKNLALYVVTRLSGVDDYLEGESVSRRWRERYRLHIAALKEKLGTSIIPVGFLRIGALCERALLFKALADSVAIPTALVKGENGLYWNEVAIMPGIVGETAEYGIVDLMKNIGYLYNLRSPESEAYLKIPTLV